VLLQIALACRIGRATLPVCSSRQNDEILRILAEMSTEKKSTTIPSGETSFRAAVQETPTAKDSLSDVDQEMPSVEVPSSSAAVQQTSTTDHTTPSVKNQSNYHLKTIKVSLSS
jgi:hypothetical protein